jgi:hypothetical protein
MKQFYALLLLFFLFPGISPAQDVAGNINVVNPLLTTEAPDPRSQLWGKEQDRVTGHISKSKLSKMKHLTEAIITFFHDSCISELPYSPIWHGEYFSVKTSSGTQMKFSVQCNFYDQKANLTIMANDISPLLDHLVVNNQVFFTIKPAVAGKNDCPYFEYTINREDANEGSTIEREESKTLRSKIWLVTAAHNQLPYIPVTRKEYLQEARMELNNIKTSLIAKMKQKMLMRSAAVQEADKKAALEQLTTMYSGTDLQVRMKMFLNNYITDEEYLKDNMDKGTADINRTLRLMDSLLNHLPPAELNKPAIVSVQAAEFRGFEDGHADKMLIRINSGYLNPYLNVEKPLFFLVCWNYDPSEPMADAIDSQIQERFDCEKLKEMLGK